MVPEDMFNNGDRIMSPPPLFEEGTETKQQSVLCGSFEGSNGHNFNCQEDNNETTMVPLPPAFSAEEDQRKLKHLTKRITIIERVKAALTLLILLLTGLSPGVFGIPFKVCEVSLYIIWIVSHAFFYSCLSFVQHWLLTPLVDECNIVSCRIEGQRHCSSAHWSNKVVFWCFHLPYLLTTAGIWQFISYMDFQEAKEGTYEYRRQFGIGIFLGALLALLTIYVLWPVDPIYIEPKIKECEREQGNDNTDRRVDLEMHELSRTEDQLKMERIEEITKARNEVLQSNASFSQLLQEKDKIIMELLRENKRSRQESVEGNSGTQLLSTEYSNIGEEQQESS